MDWDYQMGRERKVVSKGGVTGLRAKIKGNFRGHMVKDFKNIYIYGRNLSENTK